MNQTIQTNISEDRLVNSLRLLGDKTRFKIFKLLMNSEQMCVSEIAASLEVSPSAISQHFNSLELIGLVSKKRYGQKICYVLTNDLLVNEFKDIINITKGD